MARTPWSEKNETTMDMSDIIKEANYKALDTAVVVADGGGNWLVDDVKGELGGSRNRHSNQFLAQKMLEYKGKEVNQKNINSQMRSIQAWEAYQSGRRAKRDSAPSKANQAILNDIGRRAAHGRQSLTVSINGDTTVNGYRRNRNMKITLNPEQAQKFMANPSFDALAKAAHGVSELHAFGDAEISAEWNQ